jgi:alpha-ketoglutarate-dependent taurine dioxygenase
VKTRALSTGLGAEVEEIDTSQPLPPEAVDAILDLFLRHHLVVVHDQSLDMDQLGAFARQFGELEDNIVRLNDGNVASNVHLVSNIGVDGKPTSKPNPVANYFWHTDKSYYEIPSLTTVLYGAEVPSSGGDTEYANMHLAYEALPESEKERLGKLHVVHSWEASRINAGDAPATEEEIRLRPPVTHPLVRTHPDTGRKSLYMGIHTSHIAEMPQAAGRALLDELIQHATQPQFVHVHQWRVGDVLMWDNRCLMHRAVANYRLEEERRVLYRTVVRGTKPY